jgi:hypothetical protein
MKRASSSAQGKRTITRSEPLPDQTSPRKPAPVDSVGDIRAQLEQRTHQPLHLAAEQQEASHSAREAPPIRDLLV